MKMLTVTARTPTGFASGDPWSPTLDGTLSYAFMREKLGADFGNNLNLHAVEGLPFAVEWFGGEWWYVCGSPRPSQALGQRDRHFHRRFNAPDAERWMAANRVNTTMGPHKNLRKAHLVTTASSVSWQAIGDAAEIRRLLSSLHSIGSGHSRGLGRVGAWEVVEGPWAYPLERPVPVGATDRPGPIMHHSIRPPSHLASNRVRCVMPVPADFGQPQAA